MLVITPPATPVMNAMTGLNIAKGKPRSDHVTSMESTPVCGVEIMKETAEPFEAPLLWSETPVGITPHEHNGRGTPRSEA